jgi:hypothetical protein
MNAAFASYCMLLLIFASFCGFSNAFTVNPRTNQILLPNQSRRTTSPAASTYLLFGKLSNERKKQLGVDQDEDEYDLGRALETNTDPLITKMIAGSLIVVIIGLLIVAVIIPSTTDYGEGICNPLLTGGRCK